MITNKFLNIKPFTSANSIVKQSLLLRARKLSKQLKNKKHLDQQKRDLSLVRFATSCNLDFGCIHQMTDKQIVTAFNSKIVL